MKRTFCSGLKDLAIFAGALLFMGYGAILLYESFTGPRCFIYWGGRHSPQVWKLWSDDFILCTSVSAFHVAWEVLCVFGLYYWAVHNDK